MSWVGAPIIHLNPPQADQQLVPSLPSIPGWSRAAPSSKDETVTDAEQDDVDIDAPPMFPLPDSHQRSQAPAPLPTSTPSFSIAPPSPPRIPDEPASDLNIAILPDATPLGDMAPPPSTTTKPNFGLQSGGDNPAPKKKRGKVALGQGYSALDWARLTSSGKDLKGTGMGFMRVTMAELAKVSFLRLVNHSR